LLASEPVRDVGQSRQNGGEKRNDKRGIIRPLTKREKGSNLETSWVKEEGVPGFPAVVADQKRSGNKSPKRVGG